MKDVKRFRVYLPGQFDRLGNNREADVVYATDYDAALSKLAAETLRADTAEAENKLLRHQLTACSQELRKASSWICRKGEAGTTSATHWAIRLRTNADQLDAALNPKPEAGSHE